MKFTTPLLRNSLFAIVLSTFALASAVYAGEKGQIDFDDLSAHYGEPMVEVNLSANLMNMMGKFAKHEEPEVAEMLSKLDYVKVRVYEIDSDSAQANDSVASMSKRLMADEWETLVTVNDNRDKKNVRIFSKSTGDIIEGVVVMVVAPEHEEGKAAFINIVGEIDPNQIATITDGLDININ